MKTMSRVPNLGNIKGIHYAGIRSIPKAQRSSYLELYVLDREMDRLEKELFALDKRRNSAQKRFDLILGRKEKLQKEIIEQSEGKTSKSLPIKKPLTKMSIKY